jgi:hypothetical protein
LFSYMTRLCMEEEERRKEGADENEGGREIV